MDMNEMRAKYEKQLEELTEEEIKNLAILGLMVTKEFTKRIFQIMKEVQNRGTQ